MKNLFYFFVCVVFLGCNDNYKVSRDENPDNSNLNCSTRYSYPKDAAHKIAQTFVKQTFSEDCKFEKDVVLEKTMVENRYQVMQKFKSNKQGIELTYVYKIFIQYFDDDVNDVSNWEFGQLIVEEVNNGKQEYFRGNLESREKKSLGIGKTVEFNGIQFKIIDARNGTTLKFSHKGELSRKKLGEALKEMHEVYGYKFYHIYRDTNLSEDYLTYNADPPGVFDYDNNKIYVSIDAYIENKPV